MNILERLIVIWIIELNEVCVIMEILEEELERCKDNGIDEEEINYIKVICDKLEEVL